MVSKSSLEMASRKLSEAFDQRVSQPLIDPPEVRGPPPASELGPE